MAITINFQIEDVKRNKFKFTGVEELKDFARDESKFWQDQWKLVSAIGHINQNPAIAVGTIWREVFNTLESWKDNLAQWDEQTAQNNLNNQFNNWRNQLNGRWIWSGNPFNSAWIDSYKLSQAAGDAFIDAITRGNSNQCSTFDSLQGYILAYEFLLQDENTLTKRRNGEEKSFSRLRNQLAEKKDELIGQVVKFQEGIAGWKEETQEQYKEWFSEKQENYRSWKQDQDESYAVEHEQHKSQFDQQMSEWVGKIADLEHTYHEKLRLEKPAEYWRLRAKKLRDDGMNYLKSLIVLVFIGVMYFSYLFVSWLSGVKTTNRYTWVSGRCSPYCYYFILHFLNQNVGKNDI
jgi:hypothetical protein